MSQVRRATSSREHLEGVVRNPEFPTPLPVARGRRRARRHRREFGTLSSPRPSLWGGFEKVWISHEGGVGKYVFTLLPGTRASCLHSGHCGRDARAPGVAPYNILDFGLPRWAAQRLKPLRAMRHHQQ